MALAEENYGQKVQANGPVREERQWKQRTMAGRTAEEEMDRKQEQAGGEPIPLGPGAGIMEADDCQVMTVFTVQPSFHHQHSTNRVS